MLPLLLLLMPHAPLSILAPLSGFICPLDEVPDPVFAEHIIGEGGAIEPSSQLLVAPISGEVLEIHPSRHAITLRSDEGLELLLHIGLDTVLLRGEGFFPLVNAGERINAGQPLIDFDADRLALSARSLITAVIITNSEQISHIELANGHVEAGQDRLMTVHWRQKQQELPRHELDFSNAHRSGPIVVGHRGGLHARPAAQLAHAVKGYRATVHLQHKGHQADARSVVELLGLNIKHGDEVELLASGSDAEQALAQLRQLLSQEGSFNPEEPQDQEPSLWVAPQADERRMIGVAASPGVVSGTIYHLRRNSLHYQARGAGVEAEQQRLIDALDESRTALRELRQQLHDDGAHDRAAIFAAHSEILDDPVLFQEARRHIYAGKSAAYAWDQSIQAQRAIVARVDNSLIAARAVDIDDIGRRVLTAILGGHAEQIHCPAGSILIADDLTPSDTVRLDKERVCGFCTTRGSATSHVAILARSLGIPAVTGVEARALQLSDGEPVILDGSLGHVICNPNAAELARAQALTASGPLIHAADAQAAATLDGRQIRVAANISSVAEAERAAAAGADGVGLLRTEFLYLDRTREPTEAEQTRVLADICTALGPLRPLVVRSLDIGGDKPVPYLHMSFDENPELGLRGLRFGLVNPAVLRRQIRAVLRAADRGNVKLMLPMVASVDEFRLARQVVEEECQHLQLPLIPLGAMIEIPAAALKSAQLAEVADFFSIGTNDLTQYTLAMDRGHPRLAPFLDALDPAVLRLIALAVEGAAGKKRAVSVCGSAAGDPCAVPLLIGLGIDELSMNPELIPPTKALIRKLNCHDCAAWAQLALTLPDAQSVRAMMAQQLARTMPPPAAATEAQHG